MDKTLIVKGKYKVVIKDADGLPDSELKKRAIAAVKETIKKDSPEVRLFTKEGKLVEVGDILTDFRGNKAKVMGWALPRHPGSTGRVHVIYEDNKQWGERELFPSVFGLDWKPNMVNKAEDTFVEDVPVTSPEEEVSITFNEKLSKGKDALTYSMVETAFKDRSKDNAQTFLAYVDVVLDSLRDDIANAKYLVSGEMKGTRKLLLEDYVKVEHLLEKGGFTEKLAEMKPLVDQLSDVLDLDTWKKPKFNKASRKKASQGLRNLHRFDSKISKKMKPVFLCTKTELTKSYNDAKNGKLPKVFEANLEKVRKDMAADYDRIMQGRDTYVEDPRIAQTLPEIIDLYQTARDYADDLEYSDFAKEFDMMLNTIKKGWGLAGA